MASIVIKKFELQLMDSKDKQTRIVRSRALADFCIQWPPKWFNPNFTKDMDIVVFDEDAVIMSNSMPGLGVPVQYEEDWLMSLMLIVKWLIRPEEDMLDKLHEWLDGLIEKISNNWKWVSNSLSDPLVRIIKYAKNHKELLPDITKHEKPHGEFLMEVAEFLENDVSQIRVASAISSPIYN
ncbi:G-patch domain-containing protein [Apiospora arundinis]